MATLRKDQEFWLGAASESKIRYDVRYQSASRNSAAFFAAIPQNQEALPGMEGVQHVPSAKSKRNDAYGFMGDTEKEAIDKLKKYMVADYNQGVIKEKMICIQNDKSTRSSHNSAVSVWQEGRVTFKYRLAVKVTRKGSVKYFETDISGKDTSQELEPSYHTFIPWTEDREANCKQIHRLFENLQERINTMVQTNPTDMLDRNIRLLLEYSK